MLYLTLFWEFFVTGLFSIGGGMATLPFLYSMADRHPEWFTREMLADMIAVSESTPGPVGINMATYAGYRAGSVLGAAAAVAGIVFPSLVVIIIIARLLNRYSENKYVKNVFKSLRPASAALISAAVLTVLLQAIPLGTLLESGRWGWVDTKSVLLFAALLAATNIKPLKKLHPMVYIAVAAGAGILFM